MTATCKGCRTRFETADRVAACPRCKEPVVAGSARSEGWGVAFLAFGVVSAVLVAGVVGLRIHAGGEIQKARDAESRAQAHIESMNVRGDALLQDRLKEIPNSIPGDLDKGSERYKHRLGSDPELVRLRKERDDCIAERDRHLNSWNPLVKMLTQ